MICFRATQFRWIQKEGTGERQSWGVDHVYIGEACPGLCSGHGYCTSGVVCICDEGHHGGPQTAYYVQTATVDTYIFYSHLYWSGEKVNICNKAEKLKTWLIDWPVIFILPISSLPLFFLSPQQVTTAPSRAVTCPAPSRTTLSPAVCLRRAGS